MIKILLVFLLVYSQNIYATEQIKFLVGFAPGGGQHTVTNIISNAALREGINNRIIFKEGAGGIIGMNECVALRSKETLCMATQAQYAHSIILDDSIRKYDPEKLTYVRAIGISPQVLVTNISNTKSLDKIITDIKSNKVSFGSGALGLSLTTDWFLKQINPNDAVTLEFRGTGPVITNIIGKQIDYAILPYVVAKPFYNQGQVRILATLGASEELTKSGIPMLTTIVPGLEEDYTIFGFVMAPNIDKDIVKKFEDMIEKLVASSEVKEQFIEQGIFPLPKKFQNLTFADVAKNERIRIKKQLELRFKR